MPRPTIPQGQWTDQRGNLTRNSVLYLTRLTSWISGLQRFGGIADRPPANAVDPTTIYVASDTGHAYMSDGTSWIAIV